jgi:hypothetical protein
VAGGHPHPLRLIPSAPLCQCQGKYLPVSGKTTIEYSLNPGDLPMGLAGKGLPRVLAAPLTCRVSGLRPRLRDRGDALAGHADPRTARPQTATPAARPRGSAAVAASGSDPPARPPGGSRPTPRSRERPGSLPYPLCTVTLNEHPVKSGAVDQLDRKHAMHVSILPRGSDSAARSARITLVTRPPLFPRAVIRIPERGGP